VCTPVDRDDAGLTIQFHECIREDTIVTALSDICGENRQAARIADTIERDLPAQVEGESV
jgi:hypothetical protein